MPYRSERAALLQAADAMLKLARYEELGLPVAARRGLTASHRSLRQMRRQWMIGGLVEEGRSSAVASRSCSSWS